MYNNVMLSYDGNRSINITFDQLNAGQNIAIVVHSLIPDNQNEIKVGVGATLKNGKFICRKQLSAKYGMIQMLATAACLNVLFAIPMISYAAKMAALIALSAWWPTSIKLVDVINCHSVRRKVLRK